MDKDTYRFEYASSDPVEVMLSERRSQLLQWIPSLGGRVESFGSNAVKLHISGEVGEIRLLTVRMGHGVTAGCISADVAQPWLSSGRSQGLLVLSAYTAGCLYVNSSEKFCLSAGKCLVVLQQPGQRGDVLAPAGQHVAGVRIAIDPERFVQDFRLPGGVERLRAVIQGMACVELDLPLQRLVQDCVALQPERTGALLKLESSVLALIAGVMEKVLEADGGADDERVLESAVLPQRVERQVRDARRLLQLNLAEPPSVPELARRVGSNPTKLVRGFKALYGETVVAAVLRLRMQQAARLLRDRLAISEVAHRVGYRHHSSFTAAFTGFYGVSPSSFIAEPPAVH